MDVTSYLLGKQAGGGTPINNQNKDITVTENGTTTVSADAGYTGLGTVGVTTNVQPDLESKSITITENGTTTVTPTAGKDGLSEVEVTTNVPTSGPDLSEYFGDTISAGASSLRPGIPSIIKRVKSPLTASSGSLAYAFTKMTNLVESPSIINTENVENTTGLFYYCSGLVDVNLSDFNMGKLNKIGNMFFGCTNLTNLVFGYDLGKGFSTSTAANYMDYTVDLSSSSLLSHDSLISVINGLYDIASAGVQPQQLILGSTNLAKLTQAEIDIAVNKGWNVS